jgi:TPP-dependent pyruvate/acetoin dehydrogenase alpha subunit
MVAELYGKSTGCTRGKGGSMHLIDTAAGVMGTSAVVGTTIANSVGYAYAMKFQRKDTLVASFFGDGASEEGVFHESLNFAVLKQLPIIFICENNGYAIHTHQSRRQANTRIVDKAKAYGMTAERVENNDALLLHERVQTAVNQMRDGREGPFFFECMTYRWREHVGPGEDFHLGFRSQEEARCWVESDQVKRLANLVAPAARQAIEADVEAEVREAFEFADASPYPVHEDLHSDVYKAA